MISLHPVLFQLIYDVSFQIAEFLFQGVLTCGKLGCTFPQGEKHCQESHGNKESNKGYFFILSGVIDNFIVVGCCT